MTSAVYPATGTRVRQLPIHLEKLLKSTGSTCARLWNLKPYLGVNFGWARIKDN
jgi:hypothetical protein